MSTLHLKNTYTKAVERFESLDPAQPPARPKVLLYSCGPTVYSFAHIGNFRSFLLPDVLRRVLQRRGYDVRHVMNITDVGHMTEDHLADATGEDKLAKAARDLGSDPYKVAEHFTAAFVADAKALRLINFQGADADDPILHPRATHYVAEMLAMIQSLLERGYAYTDSVGQVYFEIARFPDYGRLSGKVIDELESGARVGVREEKKDPRDFALWKVDDKHLMQWDPHSANGWPAGDFERLGRLVPGGIDARVKMGFPGWHIECSAMARACLGDVIDLHTGGEDNIFPHHECEVAQSFGSLGVTTSAPTGGPNPGEQRPSFSRYWVHGRHLLVDNRKMSKRDGTFFTVRDLLDPVAARRPEVAEKLVAAGFADGRVPATVLRFALLSSPYTQPLNFTFDLLVQARATVQRTQTRYERLREIVSAAKDPSLAGPAAASVRELIARLTRDFDAALDDNLNISNAITALSTFIGELNSLDPGPADAAEALVFLDEMDAIFDVLDRRERSGVVLKASLDARLGDEDLQAALAGGSAADAALLAREGFGSDETQLLIAVRHAAKKAKDFARADGLRKALTERGVVVEDLPTGVRWKLP